MAEVLNVKVREERGKRRIRRLRSAGQTPMVLYGHKEASVSLSAPTSEIETIIRHGNRLVDLKGAVNEKALLHDVQWDVFGVDVLHLDLIRISEDERVEIAVAIVLRGEAPGAKEGGVVEQPIHELNIECAAVSIPHEIEVNINDLHLGGAVSVADLEVPSGVKVLDDPQDTVVQCVEPAVVPEEEEEAGVPGAAEPEVIGHKEEGGETEDQEE